MRNILMRRSGLIALLIGAVTFVPIYLECLRSSQAFCALQSLPADCVSVVATITAALIDLLVISGAVYFFVVMLGKTLALLKEFPKRVRR